MSTPQTRLPLGLGERYPRRTMPTSPIRAILSFLVAAHLVGNLWHGDAHATLDVQLPTSKWIYVAVVILIAPVVGAGLLWTRHALLGGWTIGASMAGSVVFSVLHHYVWISNDNVEHLPAGPPEAHAQFADSAAFIALAALTAALAGFYVAGHLGRSPD